MEPIIHHPLEYQLGPIPLTGFGLAVLLSFVVAQYIAEHELERRGHDNRAIGDLIIAAVIGGLLGAKIYYVVLSGGGFAGIFERAGFVFWGGLIGGTVAVLSVAYFKKLNLYRILDVGGICVAAAYAVGRTGCWAVGDDYGRPWNSPLAVQFPEGAPPSTWESLSRNFGIDIPAGVNPFDVASVHPTQIYEVTLAVGMFFILWRLRNHLHAEGWLFGVYCVLAGIERFVIEFFRAKDDAGRLFDTFSIAQGIAFGFVLVGVAFLVARAQTGPNKPGILAKGTS
jgi:phosphatidylglycerol:prolipoprotein diacylglycerol transferase